MPRERKCISDPIGSAVKLRTALGIMAEGRGKFKQRMDGATMAVVHLRANEFPPRLHPLISRVTLIRGTVRVEHSKRSTTFDFTRLTPRQRQGWVRDVLALYDECLIQACRTYPEFAGLEQRSEIAATGGE